jgi:hypothetical protein
LPDYEYYIDPEKGIQLKTIKELDKFNPDLLNIGNLKEPSKPIEVLSVVFDLEGFTNFTKQVDPQLSIPNYISDFFNWLFAEVKRRRRTPQQAVGHARRRRRLIEIDEL